MLQAVKRLVGADRNAPPAQFKPPVLDLAKLQVPVAAARGRLDAAIADHKQSLERSAQLTSASEAAQAVFDAEGNEASADALSAALRELERHALFVARTQRAAVTAEGVVVEAEKARDAVIAANYKNRVDNAGARLVALWEASGKPALLAFAEFTAEAEGLIWDAQEAGFELSRLNGDDSFKRSGIVQGIDALRGMLRVAVERDLGVPRVIKIGRLIGL